jgi:YfiH family protein
VHGAAALIVRRGVGADTAHVSGQAPHVRADVLASDDGAVALAVQTADCVPLLLADARTGAVAVVHAGWRGIAARAPAAGVDAMARAFGSRASALVAAIGPAVGACCYEVGDEVRDELAAAGFDAPQLDRWFSRTALALPRNPPMPGVCTGGRPGHWFFDAWTAVRDALEAHGVRAEQIHPAGFCTASHPHVFSSYRREGRNGGRMAAVIRPARYAPSIA